MLTIFKQTKQFGWLKIWEAVNMSKYSSAKFSHWNNVIVQVLPFDNKNDLIFAEIWTRQMVWAKCIRYQNNCELNKISLLIKKACIILWGDVVLKEVWIHLNVSSHSDRTQGLHIGKSKHRHTTYSESWLSMSQGNRSWLVADLCTNALLGLSR